MRSHGRPWETCSFQGSLGVVMKFGRKRGVSAVMVMASIGSENSTQYNITLGYI